MDSPTCISPLNYVTSLITQKSLWAVLKQGALVKKSKMLYFIKKGIRSTAENILPVLYAGIYDSCIHKNHSVFIKVHVA